MISSTQIEGFRRDGYLHIKRAIEPELALALQGVVWDEYRELWGIERDDRRTWKQPRKAPVVAKRHALNAQIEHQLFTSAISELLGGDDWQRPANWGGFVVKFPEGRRTVDFEIPHDTWHWDGSPWSHGLLVFTLYGEVRHAGGGTLIASGSPRWIQAFYESMPTKLRKRAHKDHRRALPDFDPWLAGLMGRRPSPEHRSAALLDTVHDVRGIPTRVVELRGEPGDTWFCNLGMLHAVVPNYGDEVRFLRVKFLKLGNAGQPALE